MEWVEDKADKRWVCGEHMILRENLSGMHKTLEAALIAGRQDDVFSWKGPDMLYRDMISFASLDKAKEHAEKHNTITMDCPTLGQDCPTRPHERKAT